MAFADFYLTIKSSGFKYLIGAALTVFAGVFAYVLYGAWEASYRREVIPYGMPVSKVRYAKEASWGFGPGGNEAGVIVFELPDAVALEIQRSGIAYFTSLPKRRSRPGEWRGIYELWSETPVPPSENWGPLPTRGAQSSSGFVPMLSDYLDRYGFGIPIDGDVHKQIDDAIQSPGSYFAYGRIGMLIVAPRERSVFYVYNG